MSQYRTLEDYVTSLEELSTPMSLGWMSCGGYLLPILRSSYSTILTTNVKNLLEVCDFYGIRIVSGRDMPTKKYPMMDIDGFTLFNIQPAVRAGIASRLTPLYSSLKIIVTRSWNKPQGELIDLIRHTIDYIFITSPHDRLLIAQSLMQ